jgi:hypothetical protein
MSEHHAGPAKTIFIPLPFTLSCNDSCRYNLLVNVTPHHIALRIYRLRSKLVWIYGMSSRWHSSNRYNNLISINEIIIYSQIILARAVLIPT